MSVARRVAAGGQAEVELATLAQQKSNSNDVKTLASRIQTDHMKANDELARIASQKGWDLPTEPAPWTSSTPLESSPCDARGEDGGQLLATLA